ncbi:1797_t:CDS:1 [Funneliformis geosporum]|uniref:12226_t:CDS:1 n=1 Tax=Funneliformis geosporum TaxID=1117311 RepID=A0A9W4SW84_9GLOM|nr:1797_t:CDS:1 [Funneliformis geosporum]CAI2185631.1 12226_t:CDS:1 [Funneliformis geosporum]
MDPKDAEYLSFLEDYEKKTQPFIQPKEVPLTITQMQDPTTFPADIQRIRETLLEASSQLLYISEAEEPYEFIFIPNEEISELPSNCEEFKSLIKKSNITLTEEEESAEEGNENNILDFGEFFNPFTVVHAEDPYGQRDGYKELQKIIEATFHGKENVRIYKVGSHRKIGVFIVGLVKGVGIVGLKTLSVET